MGMINKNATPKEYRDFSKIPDEVVSELGTIIGKCPINRSRTSFPIKLHKLIEWSENKCLIIQGHRDFPNVNKACPCFDAKAEYRNL